VAKHRNTGIRSLGARLRSRAVIIGIVLLLCSAGVAAWRLLSRTDRCVDCNIVLVTFDALRADHLHFMGYRRATSPRLDEFAREASVFLDAMSQSGTTRLSLASLFTSRYPLADGEVYQASNPSSELHSQTLMEVLRERGYTTAAVVGTRMARLRCERRKCFNIDIAPEAGGDYESAADTTRKVLGLLPTLKEPFFLWVHYRPPHAPYRPSAEEVVRLGQGLSLSEARELIDTLGAFQMKPSRRQKADETFETFKVWGADYRATPSMVDDLALLYDGNIANADEHFGKLVESLDRRFRKDRLIIAVTADHGESLGEHHLFDHNALWYGVLHVPLLLRAPAAPARRFSHPVMTVDLLPTFEALLGLDPGALHRRGRSLFDSKREDDVQFAEFASMKTIKAGAFKLLVEAAGGMSLFDVVNDPNERRNVLKEHKDIAASLFGRLKEISPALVLPVEDPVFKELRSLGYIH
jgi:arylsulfatase A-like enzyme